MRKLIALLLALTLLLTPCLAEEEELSIDDVLSGADPGVVSDTFIAPPDDADEYVLLGEDGSVQEVESIYEPDGSVLITVTGTGDFTIGGDCRKSSSIFETELRKHDDVSFTMQNVRDILLEDDLTIVNFEGTLTNSTYIPSNKRENQFLFSAPPEYVSALSENGVEAVALENNHVMDHGQDAYEDTMATLEEAGIVYSHSTQIGVYEAKGVEIAMLSYLCIDRYESLWDKVPADIAAAKEQYPIVIVNFHWGNETWYYPTDNQVKMGRLAVDSGADLVLGHHSHRINPIECYKGVYICYSLGNFCFAGNSKPSDMSSYLFQTRFRVRDGEVSNEGFRIIPIRISSRTERNDFIPTPLTKETAVDAIMNTLKDNGRRLEYAVEEYPTQWYE